MSIRWLTGATRSLRAVHHFIAADNQAAARRVVVRIERAVERLDAHPLSGRQGTVAGTRELVVPGLPYLVVYRIQDADVIILRVLHTKHELGRQFQ